MAARAKKEVAETSWELLHQEVVRLYFPPPPAPPPVPTKKDKKAPAAPVEEEIEAPAGIAQPERTIERMGFDVGVKLAEKYSKERPRFADDLDVITFICKDFWLEIFRKQIDKLRTNHKGVYELQDFKFRALSHLSSLTPPPSSSDPSSSSSSTAASGADGANAQSNSANVPSNDANVQQAQRYLLFSCGIVRGALSNFGVAAIVTADISSLPSCTFLVKVK